MRGRRCRLALAMRPRQVRTLSLWTSELPAASTGIVSAQAGVSVSFMWACNPFAQYPGGRYAQQFSSNVIFLTSQVVVAVGFLLLFLSTTFSMFLLGLGLVGAGYGTFEPAGMVLIHSQFDERRSRAFGIRDATVNLGSVLSAALALIVVGGITWRDVFLPVATLLGVVSVGNYLTLNESYDISVCHSIFSRWLCDCFAREKHTLTFFHSLCSTLFGRGAPVSSRHFSVWRNLLLRWRQQQRSLGYLPLASLLPQLRVCSVNAGNHFTL